MPVFTVITEVGGSFHVSQHTAATPKEALFEHVATFPYDDGGAIHAPQYITHIVHTADAE